jgi:uncharacterized membrane protein YphA (DoxX/SURF4 family)
MSTVTQPASSSPTGASTPARLAARDGASLFLRWALAAAFLSAVADRFGLWGPPGGPGVSWGNFANFAAYSAKLTFFLPASLGAAAAWAATAAEVVLAVALLLGLFPRATGLLSGLLLLTFALSMAVALRPKAPLDYSVFTASAAAFLLATLEPDRFTIPGWFRRRKARIGRPPETTPPAPVA